MEHAGSFRPVSPLAERSRHEIIPLFQIYSTDKPCETRVDESNWLRASFFLALTPCRDVFRARSRKEKEKEKKKEIRGKEVEKRRNHGIFREKTKRDVVADVVNFSSFRAGWMEKKKRQGKREKKREREVRKKIINWTWPDPFSHVNSAGEQKWLAEWYSAEDRFLFSPARGIVSSLTPLSPTFLFRPLVFHVAFLSFV